MKKIIYLSLIAIFATSIFFITCSKESPTESKKSPWIRKKGMTYARAWFSCEVVNGKIYTIGWAPRVEEYDPVADTWTCHSGRSGRLRNARGR